MDMWKLLTHHEYKRTCCWTVDFSSAIFGFSHLSQNWRYDRQLKFPWNHISIEWQGSETAYLMPFNWLRQSRIYRIALPCIAYAFRSTGSTDHTCAQRWLPSPSLSVILMFSLITRFSRKARTERFAHNSFAVVKVMVSLHNFWTSNCKAQRLEGSSAVQAVIKWTTVMRCWVVGLMIR